MKESIKVIKVKRHKRTRRVRATLKGSSARPRLSVFFSLKHVSVQCIDDMAGKTLFALHDTLTGTGKGHVSAIQAREFGKKAAAGARGKGITSVIFDRGGRAYHGRIQALAEGAREGGLQF